ncbi:MAG: glycosyltransferase family 4 protein [Ruminococcus sp.]|nr:glycosyltransferase family 4 protein [Ruminococcus sp.]
MKVGFLFDVKLLKYNGHYYSVNLNEQLWNQNYFPYFDKIKLICRYVDSSEDPSSKMHRTDIPGVEVCAMTNKGAIKRMLHINEENKKIAEYLQDCDVVICRGFWGVKQSRALNKPYLIEVVSCYWDSMWNHSIFGKFFAGPMFLTLKSACAKAKYVMYVSEHFLQSRYPTRGKCIGVSDVITTPMTKEEINFRIEKAKLPCENNTIKIGTTAAVNVAYKGQKYVIRAMKMLSDRGINNIEYHMVGGGDNSLLLNEAKLCGIESKIIFHGSLPHNKVTEFLDSLDIYIQPSFQEGLPRAVVEAMARGVPCIGSNTGGIPELINPSFICNKKHLAEELAEKIEIMLEDQNRLVETKRSIERAKAFEKNVLAEKRKLFMNDFKNFAMTSNGKK